MKFARLLDGKKETYGIVKGDRVASREEIVYSTGVPLPTRLGGFLFEGWLAEVNDRLDGLEYERGLSEYGIMAPIAEPPKIFCLAFNYADHAQDQDRSPPDEPVIVMKPRTALCGNGDDIVMPPFVKELDYEVELALIIGKRCRDVDVIGAKEAIFGYTILNDVSARDIQFRDGQFTRAKGLDTFAPCGPWITSADEVQDPGRLKMTTKVNGRARQDSSTSKMHIKPFEIVSKLSSSMTLEKGDIISTGTPSGVALNNPDSEYLAAGDEIEMEIEGLGVLRNTVRGTRE
ncbi:2-keto-4-pentenoate hydratase/2-oxohepta-3-ene-1, 7-dioic acid hydratase [Cenarchaeum symbiosum A]|uniref:2-keto-4-pentenoate hydratase/2-oxohepta-3-ene-1, 7-dioic acid hydratase n=1 Tax=Cenarchaeum symbiosum (strain A) TaxID=414004 RepID=A0RY21_CENSY|nr:2-keto-4-pentenoate hydratase/2-oxohepta-3-ene-1, 7-dioic acid hydratase [Cenarchaeum symbiosum A]